MIVWRKAASAQWNSKSASQVDTVDIGPEAWSGSRYVYFSGTIDKSGDRHTELRLALNEGEVEALYEGLQKTRREKAQKFDKTKNAIRNFKRQASKHRIRINPNRGTKVDRGEIDAILALFDEVAEAAS